MTLKKTVEWFQQAVPAPDNKTLSVQLGCHQALAAHRSMGEL